MDLNNEDDLKNKLDLQISGRHTALDIFCFAVFFQGDLKYDFIFRILKVRFYIINAPLSYVFSCWKAVRYRILCFKPVVHEALGHMCPRDSTAILC